MLLAATNLPWELDEAMRRRLTKRVYIPLPEADARRALFHLNLKRVELAPDVDVEELVQETQVRSCIYPPILSNMEVVMVVCVALCRATVEMISLAYVKLVRSFPVRFVSPLLI